MAIDRAISLDLFAAFILFLSTHYFLRLIISKPPRKLPPGPRGWPIIGSLPLLGDKPHVSLANMAKQYGPVMYLKLGFTGMAVVSTPEAARAFLKTLDNNFVNRPPHAGSKYMAYNAEDMVFADYGPKWRLLRKLSNTHMLGASALDESARIRAVEVGIMLKAMCEHAQRGQPLVLPEMLTFVMANVISQVILGYRLFNTQGDKSSEFNRMVVELMTMAGLFNIGDFIPAIEWMDLQGIQRDMKVIHKKFDKLITRMINEHSKSADERKGKPDFLDILMAHQNNSTMSISFTNIKALLLNLFTAGTDTSSSIVEWAMSEMLENPTILKRAQQEMDQVIGRNRRLLGSDIPNLPYLQAICKETFRKHPSTPLNLPRVSSEACEVGGYYIPKDTRLAVNIWAIGRDPDVWEEPLSFNPERFLSGKNASIDPRGNHFELIPFGSGKRICSGTRMGIVMVEYILGTLVHSFDWKLPEGVTKLDMNEIFGIALQKAVPLSPVVTPRLSPSAYTVV